jgi:hypothetical protein
MDHAFTYRLESDDIGGVLLQFIDVPEAHTFAPTVPDRGANPALCVMLRGA